jgi:uncharacterized protein YcbK (DUF882 family)
VIIINTKDVQKKIYSLGLKNIFIDGFNGPQTKMYIKGIQYATGIYEDGIVGEKTIKAMEKLLKDKKVKHFNDKEFECPCCKEIRVDLGLKLYLEIIRRRFKNIVVINSGYRCDNHNRKVRGARHSQHKKGMAADIRVYNVLPINIFNFCKTLNRKFGGIGQYDEFVHFDVRSDEIAIW